MDLDGREEAVPKIQASIPKLTNVSESTCIGCGQRNLLIHHLEQKDNEAKLQNEYIAWRSNPDNIGKALPPQYSKFASQVQDQQHLEVGGYQATPEYKITKANYDTYGKYFPILSDIEGVKDIGEALKEGKVSDATIFAAGLLLPAVGVRF